MSRYKKLVLTPSHASLFRLIYKCVVPNIGSVMLNTLIDKLPIELHIPGYSYCGPGTKLHKRLQRGDKGVNPLDEACREHDIAYSKTKDIKERNLADKALAAKASKRILAADSGIGERLSSLAVSGIMKGKATLGMGNYPILIGKKPSKKRKRKSRSIQGGIIPLVPILAGLSAIGSLIGGTATAVRTAKSISQKNKALEEAKRHNLKLEQLAKGAGLYLRPYKVGQGLKKK